jgi:multimeric flavodoxin WrbA
MLFANLKKEMVILKVTAFVGSARKKHTYHAAKQFLEELQSFGNVEYEIVCLSDYDLKICKGCKLCLDREENLCPLADDRDRLIEKMMNSDGIVFASPNYSFQVSGYMKVFLDRLAYFLHRPQFFGKTYTSIVAQGIFGGKKILKYLDQVGNGMGFNTIKGVCIKTLEPIPENQHRKNNAEIKKLSNKFYSQLIKNEYPTPSLFKLMLFRMSRTSINHSLDEEYKDYNYYKEKGWFDSEYYYPVNLNPFKKMVGKLFDIVAVRMSKSN